MKIYFVTRNDAVSYDEYDSAVVVADSPKEAVQLLRKRHGEPGKYGGVWGDYDVSVAEIIPTEPEIIVESFNAG